MTDRKTLDQMTSNDLDQLHARLERAETFVTTIADIIADHEGDEWAAHPATTAIRRGFNTVPHAVGDPELRRQLAAAIRALGTSETELATLRQVARGYCPACGRGDAAPSVADWEQQKKRAQFYEDAHSRMRDRLEVTRVRVRKAVHIADAEDVTDWQRGFRACSVVTLAALDEPAPGPAATPATKEP